MSDYTKYTKQEMQAYAIAKNIKENQIVIVGIHGTNPAGTCLLYTSDAADD